MRNRCEKDGWEIDGWGKDGRKNMVGKKAKTYLQSRIYYIFPANQQLGLVYCEKFLPCPTTQICNYITI